VLSVCTCIYRGLSYLYIEKKMLIEDIAVCFYLMGVSAFWRRTKKNGPLTDILGTLTDMAKSLGQRMAHNRQRRVVDNPFGPFVCANHMPTSFVSVRFVSRPSGSMFARRSPCLQPLCTAHTLLL
jgi:hypothetical protein